MASLIASTTQLLLLIGFVCFILFLNNRRPSGTNYKPFKLLQCLSILFAVMSFFYLFQLLGGVEIFIEQSPSHLKHFISAQQGLCLKHRDIGEFHLAEKAIRDRSLLKSVLKEEKQEAKQEAKQIGRTHVGGSGLLSNDWLNFLLFSTGVSVTVLPALIQLLFRIFIHSKVAVNASPADRESHDAKLRREWGILLPIINHTTLLSFLTTFTFFFNVEGQRADKCIFTSGHWYTFICCLMTFSWIMAHLWSYRQSSAAAFRLFIVYSVYSGIYINFALTVLKNTQRYHHDASEAHDGIRSALRVFLVFLLPLLLLQYILYQWSKTKPPRRSQAPPAYDEHDESIHSQGPPAYSSAVDAAAAPLHVPAVASPPPSIPSIPDAPPSIPQAPEAPPQAPEAPQPPAAPEAPPSAPSAPSPPIAPPPPSSDSSLSVNALNDAKSRLRSSVNDRESKSSSSSDSGRPFSAADLQSSRGKLRPASSRAASSAAVKDDSMMAALKARLAAARPFLEPGADEDDKEWEVI